MVPPSLFESAPLGTFMGLPARPAPGAAPPLACIVGIPFDCGTHPFRVGSREGPDANAIQAQLKTALDTALTEAKKAAQPGQLDVRTGNFSEPIGSRSRAGSDTSAIGDSGASTRA